MDSGGTFWSVQQSFKDQKSLLNTVIIDELTLTFCISGRPLYHVWLDKLIRCGDELKHLIGIVLFTQ